MSATPPPSMAPTHAAANASASASLSGLPVGPDVVAASGAPPTVTAAAAAAVHHPRSNTSTPTENLLRSSTSAEEGLTAAPALAHASSPFSFKSPPTVDDTAVAVLNIKCPTFPDLTFSVTCARTATGDDAGDLALPCEATVADLKRLLENKYPASPKAAEQRLIFAGSLLADQLLLIKDVLKKSDLSMPQTLHLVVRNLNPSAVAAAATTPSTLPARRPHGKDKAEDPSTATAGLRHRFSSASTLSNPVSAPQSSNDLGAEMNTVAAIAAATGVGGTSAALGAEAPTLLQQQLAAVGANPFAVLPNGLPVPQVVVINGMPYLLQVNPAALPYLNASAPVPGAAAQPLPPTAFPIPTPTLAPPAAAAAAPAPAPAVPAPAQPPAAANVGAGPAGGGVAGFMAQADNPDDEFGDLARNQPPNPYWLLIKLSFLVWMFSHNASLPRFVLLHVAAFVIFAVQMGWVNLRGLGGVGNNNNGAAAAAGNRDPAAVPLVGEGAGAENNNAEDAPAEGGAANADPVAAAAVAAVPQIPPPLHQTILQEIQTLVTTFFTSLIPENQEGVVA
ncbi:hypothetical protein HDU96_002705 [Phlyctochytrium bullatum]|nr:hypothetical protein HDU96_002705 [Phlyctochytrium bullatum]